MTLRFLALGACLVAGLAAAQPATDAGTAAPSSASDRPSEESIFGDDRAAPPPSPADASAQPPGAEAPGATGSERREEQILQGAPAQDAFATGAVKEDPLRIGGQFYIRGFTQFLQDQPVDASRLSLPTLVDVYLDARPTDRLRAQVLGRLSYDPYLTTPLSAARGSTTAMTTQTSISNPSVALDQAWLAFDIARRVFITAGRQHVKWGTAQFFTPTDFLASQPRDPLAQFDARLGVTMIKAQVPWERTGWSFTAVALFESTQRVSGGITPGGTSGSTPLENTSGGTGSGTTGQALRDVGGAARAELAFTRGSLGIDGLIQRGRKARGGVDFTMSVGDFDLYGELALKNGLDYAAPPTFQTGIPAQPTFTPAQLPQPGRPVVQTAGGINRSFNFEGNKSINLGLEYFYNSAGYARAQYAELIVRGAFQSFYVGTHYLAGTASLLDTTAKTTWALSAISNLSDLTLITRLDFIVTVLSYLQVEAFVAGHTGATGGEFRFGGSPRVFVEELGAAAPSLGTIHPALVDVGLGLRLSL